MTVRQPAKSTVPTPGTMGDTMPDSDPVASRDLENLVAYVGRLGMTVICDTHGYERGVRCRHDGVPVLPAKEVAAAVSSDPTLVWLTWGCQFGVPSVELIEETLRPGRLFAIAGRSPLSGCYGATTLYVINSDKEWKELVRFCRGDLLPPKHDQC